MIRTELLSVIASARRPNLDALHDPIVSPDLKMMAEGWGSEFALDEEFFNGLRLASWKRRFVSNDADDLSRTAVLRVTESLVNVSKLRVRRE